MLEHLGTQDECNTLQNDFPEIYRVIPPADNITLPCQVYANY